jgi:hypothetical protein
VGFTHSGDEAPLVYNNKKKKKKKDNKEKENAKSNKTKHPQPNIS